MYKQKIVSYTVGLKRKRSEKFKLIKQKRSTLPQFGPVRNIDMGVPRGTSHGTLLHEKGSIT